ncbi:MAG TPA: flagellar motor protein MotB [Microbacteriaceae bacterium]|nr:flagellar motor protein MotB [Microbacteriaceae bacterium]
MTRHRPGRARRGASTDDEAAHGAGEERWMASYLDMVTVLMCTFLVMFAMSSVNANKFKELKNSLQTGFGIVKTQKVDTAHGVVVPPKDVNDPKATHPSPVALAKVELDKLEALKAAINKSLTEKGLEKDVSYTIDQRGLTIGLIGNKTFFHTNLADLTPTAERVIAAIAPIIDTVDNKVSLEGHADGRPPLPPYPTNWELAAARSIAVLRSLNGDGVPASRLDAVSYGDVQAKEGGDSAQDMADERRVDMVILSGQSEDVRMLIPKLLREEQGAGPAAPPAGTAQGAPAGGLGQEVPAA